MRIRGLLIGLVALALAISASAQTKISGTVQCKADPITPVEIGDKPGHAYAIIKSSCTWTKPMDIAGSQTKTGTDVTVSEMTGDSSNDHGYHMDTMASGDKFTVQFQGKGKSKDGKPVSQSGTWSFAGGEGKVKGIKGKGTYKGAPNPDGSITYQIDGEYSLP